MHIVLITFVAGVLISWLVLRNQTPRADAPFKAAVKYEIKGFLIALGIIAALFFLLLLFSLFFGPLPPVHEW